MDEDKNRLEELYTERDVLNDQIMYSDEDEMDEMFEWLDEIQDEIDAIEQRIGKQ